jgi:hypothetical protein
VQDYLAGISLATLAERGRDHRSVVAQLTGNGPVTDKQEYPLRRVAAAVHLR